MFARVTTVTADPDGLARWREHVTGRIVPATSQAPGFVRAFWLLDHAAGRGTSVTVWESREALETAEAAASRNRDALAAITGGAVEAAVCQVVAESYPMGHRP